MPFIPSRSKVGRCRAAGHHLPGLGGHRNQRGGRDQLHLSGGHWGQCLCQVILSSSILFLARSSLTIYKFEEPEVSQNWNGQDIVIGSQDIEHIHIRYPDYHRDCEAMAVDPLNGDILLFTKNHEQYASDVFKVPHGWGDPKTLEYIATLPYIKVTGADISPSGDTLALTNYWEGWSWTKPYPSTPWADFLKTYPTPCNIPVKEEPQREAIAVTDR